MDIRFKAHIISPEDAAHFQNFDALLHQHTALKWHRKIWRWFAGTGLCLLLAGAIWFWKSTHAETTTSPEAQQQSPQPKVEHTNPPAATKEEASVPEPTMEPTPELEAPVNGTKADRSEKKAPTTLPIVKESAASRDGNKSVTERQPLAEEQTFNFIEAEPAQGYPHLYEYFSNALEYPISAIEAAEEGTVILKFVVGEDGRPTEIAIESGLSDALNKEALRLVSEMPDWIPASINGKYTASRKTIPISFKID